MTPRFLIAAAHKSSGKTVISTGLAAAFRADGDRVQTFKKGPDYIDPMWLRVASGRPCFSLDFNTMGQDELRSLFVTRAQGADLALIEANKGLYDGVDLHGSDSNAAMAKLLNTPVILVVDATGMTRGIAPLLQGYSAFDSDVTISGVILNKVGGARHEGKLRAAVAAYSDIPVVGAVWRNPVLEIGERHLGLTTPAESGALSTMIAQIGRIVGGSVNLAAIRDLTSRVTGPPVATIPLLQNVASLRIGIAQDTAFGFYYPDDLEAFRHAGATLVPFNTLTDQHLPDIDGLFIGGGFPETQMAALSANSRLRTDIKHKILAGLPTYAECGGLMYLCESLTWQGMRHPMVGVISGDAVMYDKPQGRGYATFADTENHPWGHSGRITNAHEFHYARVENLPDGLVYGRKITRGVGIDGVQDAVIVHNLVAGFCHLRHTREMPWVMDFVDFVRANRQSGRPTANKNPA